MISSKELIDTAPTSLIEIHRAPMLETNILFIGSSSTKRNTYRTVPTLTGTLACQKTISVDLRAYKTPVILTLSSLTVLDDVTRDELELEEKPSAAPELWIKSYRKWSPGIEVSMSEYCGLPEIIQEPWILHATPKKPIKTASGVLLPTS
ncbi:hypothetical protein M378DRAFT_160270 [Amanita muscaria Koide BX008]|uniref:Uncharacterized protein n=1 Tax=Amanita muscaria (strain Koide BX008) TaxID=946122 RepID=A0A0C2STR9_AMAMK|nr:hypothetical protein M378DRAFT_160270 [Amanita muscaria Koide BX008]